MLPSRLFIARAVTEIDIINNALIVYTVKLDPRS